MSKRVNQGNNILNPEEDRNAANGADGLLNEAQKEPEEELK